MKTSSKLILAAIILGAVSLVIYDMAIRTSYLSGDYKNPYRDYVSLNYRGFNSIELDASTIANIIVKQGPFSVKMAPDAASFVRVSQHAGVLQIDAAFPGSYYNIRQDYILIISCPKLILLNTDSRYTAWSKLVTDSLASWDFTFRPTVINGFTEDSLAIQEHHASTIILNRNKIRSVKAVVGTGERCRSNMIITADNQFQKAGLDILNRSQLQLHNAHIANLKYHLADSAKLIQYGGLPNIIKTKLNPTKNETNN